MTASPSEKDNNDLEYKTRTQRAFRLTFIGGLLTLLTSFLLPLFASSQLPPHAFSISIASAILQLCGALIIYRRHIGLGLIIFFTSAPTTVLFVISQSAGIGILIIGGLLLIYMMVLPQVLANGTQIAGAQITALIVAFILAAIDLNWPLARPQVTENIFNLTLFLLVALFIVFGYLTVRQFPTYGLRGKLITTTLFVAFLAVIVVAVGVNSFTRRALTQKIGEQLDTLAGSQAALVGELFFRELTTLQALSLNDFLLTELEARNGSYTEDEAEIENMLLAVNNSWQAASRTDPIVTAVLQSPLSAELTQFRARFPENTRLIITDQYGALLAATDKPDEYYLAQTEWWQDTHNVGFGATYFGQPTINPLSGDGIIEISLPLFTTQANGVKSFSGVLFAAYSLNALEDLLVEAQYGETGQTQMHLPGYELAINENNQLAVYQDVLYSDEDLASILESEEETTLVLRNGEPALVSAEFVNTFNHQPIIDEQQWIITVQQAESEALGAVQEQQRLNMLLGALVLLVTGGAAAFVGNRLTQPILALTAVAEKVSGGDLTAQVTVESQDEIGTLANALNTMTSQIRGSIMTLEDRVQERTRALEISINVGRQLSTILDAQELVTAVVNQVRDAFNYYHAHIYLVDKNDETVLKMVGGTGVAGEQMLANNHQLRVGQGLVGQSAAILSPVWVADVTQAPDWLPNSLLPDTKSEIAVPIISGNELLGVLDVQHNIVDGLSQTDVDLIELIASQVAVALRNANLYQQAQERANRELQINEINQKILETADVQQAMRIAVRELGQVFGASKTIVRMINNNGQEGNNND